VPTFTWTWRFRAATSCRGRPRSRKGRNNRHPATNNGKGHTSPPRAVSNSKRACDPHRWGGTMGLDAFAYRKRIPGRCAPLFRRRFVETKPGFCQVVRKVCLLALFGLVAITL